MKNKILCFFLIPLYILFLVGFASAYLPTSSSSPQDEWWMHGGDTGYNRYTTANAPTNISNTANRTFTLAQDVDSAPIVIGDSVFVIPDSTYSDKAYELNASNISQVLSNSTNSYTIAYRSSPTYYRGSLFFHIDNPYLYQINATNLSQIIKSYDITSSDGGYYADPIVFNKAVYVGDGNYNPYIRHLNASNISQVLSSYISSGRVYETSPILNNYVYGATSSILLQLNASNLAQTLSSASCSANSIEGFFPVSSNYVYKGCTVSSVNTVVQFNATNLSQQIASFPKSGWGYALGNGFLYFGSGSTLYQLNASNVSQQIANITFAASISTVPAINPSNVFTAAGNVMYQLNASNISNILGSFTAGSTINGDPVIAKGFVYFGSIDNKLYQLGVYNPLPAIKINYPIDEGAYLNLTQANYTLIQNSTHVWSNCWYSSDYGITNSTSVTAGTNFVDITSIESWNNLTIYCNDSQNIIYNSSLNYYIDVDYPAFVNVTNRTVTDAAGLSYTVQATDNSGISCFGVNDTTNFKISCSGILQNNTLLNVGLYWLNITANDSVQHQNSTLMWVNVTDGTSPIVNITYPSNNTNYSISISTLNYSVSDNIALSVCWWSNSSGRWNSTTQNPSSNWTGLTSIQGWNNWTVYCNDTSGNIGRIEARFIVDTIFPNVTLNSPTDNYTTNYFGVMNISFNCSAYDNFALKNISLYITNSSNSNFALNKTTNITGTSANANWTLALANGNYTWNCLASDTLGNYNWSTNRTITINPDVTPPAFNNITNQTIYQTRAFGYQINATDTFGVSCFSVNDTTSFAINCSGYLQNNTLLDVGLYWLNITANDTSNNVNSSLIFVNVTLIPRIGLTLITPTGNINVTQNQTFQVSVNVSCSNTDCGEINVSLDPAVGTVYNFTTCGASGKYGPTQANCTANYTGTSLAGLVTVNTQGYQEFIVPVTGTYLITAYGASGGTQPEYSASKGYGALISGNATLTSGTKLIIIVGQRGSNGLSSDYEAGSGGGTFIAYGNDYTTALPLIIAGGSGGAGSDVAPINAYSSIDGSGSGCTLGGACSNQNDGAGFYFNNSVSAGAKSFRSGAVGGNASSGANFGDGGFGGGGGGTDEDGSGGGGYTGGIGIDNTADARRGGSSFINTTLVSLVQNTTTNYDGSGTVSLQLLSSTGKSGLVSTNTSATPFYTTTQNPYNLTLNNGQSQIVTWTVNATGTMWDNYTFFVYANKTSDMSVGNLTRTWNVTITNQTLDIPIVSIVYPQSTNYANDISSLNYTVLGNNLSSCWWSNSSGAWNSTAQNPGANWTGLTSILGSNTWFVYCNNTNGSIGTSSVTFSIDGVPPNVTLISPISNYAAAIVSSSNISFNCSATDNLALKNISLYITNSSNSNFVLNKTTNITGTLNNTNWTLSLGVGNYTWNCLAYDDLGNLNWSTNRTIWLETNIAPNVTLNSPLNNTLLNRKGSILLNATVSDTNGNLDNFTVWFYGGYANGTYTLINTTYNQTNGTAVTFNWTLGSSGRYNWTLIANDGKANSTISYFYFNLTNFSVSCEAGGNYQQGALVLVQGTIMNESTVVPSYPVNLSIYDSNNNLNASQNLTTASDGGFETSFANLSVGSYVLNATATYRSYTEACTDTFSVGSSVSFVLDKILSVYNLTNTTISYNITLKITNKGGSDATSAILTDSDSPDLNYSLGTVYANSSVIISYLKEYTRNSSTYDLNLAVATVNATNSYSGSEVSANSSEITLTIPAAETEQQLTLVKNAYYNSENSTHVNYTLTIDVVNSGGVDLTDISLIDSDLSVNTNINLNRTQNYNSSSSIIIDKAASNTNKLFVKATATVNSVSYESNQIQVRIPGYGGPADAIVNAPGSVSASTSFSTTITVENQNLDVGQDFVIDYWITNTNEDINYTSGQQTIYVAASGSSDLTATLTSPSTAGDYRLRALVSWAGGTATSYDSFTVTATTETPPAQTPSSSGGGGITGNVIDTIVCNTPYIRYGKECCLDKNNNSICDSDDEVYVEEIQGINGTAEKGEKVEFRIIQEDSVKNHSLEVIDLKEDRATIKIYSDLILNGNLSITANAVNSENDEIILTLYIGEENKIDLDGDGNYDLMIRLEKIEDNQAHFYLESIKGKIEIEKPEFLEEEKPEKINVIQYSKVWIMLFGILLILMIIIIAKKIKISNLINSKRIIDFYSAIGGGLVSKMQWISYNLKIKNRDSTRLSNIIGMEVLSSEGNLIGKVKEIYIEDKTPKVYGWLIKVNKNIAKKIRKRFILVKHNAVISIKQIMIVDKKVLEYLESLDSRKVENMFEIKK